MEPESAEERACFAADLRETYRRIMAESDARAEAKRQEILAEKRRRRQTWEWRIGIEFYFQLLRRARDEGWEVRQRAA